MRHTHARSKRAQSSATLRLFRLATPLVLVLLGIAAPPDVHAQSLKTSNARDLMTADPLAFAHLLETHRPAPISPQGMAIVLKSLPSTGEITHLDASNREKIAAVLQVLRASERDSVYQIKVIDVPQAGIALHGRAVILISEIALAFLTVDELRAAVAHEVAHEYVWAEHEDATQRGDHMRLRQVELVCDAIAIATLRRLGITSAPLVSGFEKMMQLNQMRLGTPLNAANYPTLAERRKFARDFEAWLGSIASHR